MSQTTLSQSRWNTISIQVKAATLPSLRWWRWLALILPMSIAVLVLMPLVYLASSITDPNEALWTRWWDTILPPMLINTLQLTLGVGIGTFIIGTVAAWLVTAYEFPGRILFDRLLLLPLAIPSFILGFVFIATFDYAGPVQTQWRDWFGDDAWFPDVMSVWGLIIVMTAVLYPYVYILARASFREQAASTFEAARVMGYSRTQTFFRLVLPLARPSIAAGVVLAMMEAMTDYGTVSFFGYPTLSEGVVRIWKGTFGFDAADNAAQLASLLMFIAFGMIVLERLLRGRAKYYQQGGEGRRLQRVPLKGWKQFVPTAILGVILGFAFILPYGRLVYWAYHEVQNPQVGLLSVDIFQEHIKNTVRIAGIASGLVIGLSIVVAHGVRVTATSGKKRIPRFIARLTTLGYAMPGAVVAVGILLIVMPIDHEFTDYLELEWGRTNPDLFFTGTMTAMLYAYVVRFMAVGFNSVDASLEKIKPSMEEAARTMGAGSFRVFRRIYIPLLKTGIAAGAILVFVDVMKEIPATLILRPPFGTDTLALWVYGLASEAFWQAAAVPSIAIVGFGLIPILLLMRIGENTKETHG
ncbi:MAG: iron ABC transporter permease [Phototrophicales bacterium]|nr:MAG: iron ABC transporter permease [Phototrophicales bacterium]